MPAPDFAADECHIAQMRGAGRTAGAVHNFSGRNSPMNTIGRETRTKSPPLVLLLDGDALDSLSTEGYLNDLGIADVRLARSADQAMALIDDTRFDLALLDFDLDEQSFTVAERLCAANVPIVVTSGLDGVALPGRCRQAAVLRKPFAFEELERAVRNA
jgi:PleD family two-component response regulator